MGYVLGSWAMFRYPHSPREVRGGRRFFAALFIWIIVGELVTIAFSRPQWYGFLNTAWWPPTWPDQPVFNLTSTVTDIGGIIFAAIYMMLWIRRWRQSRGISRRLAMPIAIAASLVGAATIVELIAKVMSATSQQISQIYTLETYLLICVPAAFLVSVLQRRFARTRIVDLLLHLRGPVAISAINDALRTVLEDDTLELIDLAATKPATGEYTVSSRPPRESRLHLPITSSSNVPMAVIRAHTSLSPNDDLVNAATVVIKFILENARLEAAVRKQVEELQASRQRIIEVATEERRRLERNLHDGAQHRLLALEFMLATSESDIDHENALDIIREAKSELGTILDELVDLARGIHPTILTQLGLRKAIQTIAERYMIPINVNLPVDRFGEVTELTAYYVITESIANAVRHAKASRIIVHGERSGGSLLIQVHDNGQGGAALSGGSGLRGLMDRVHSAGGELTVESKAGNGTHIEASIPCV